MKSSTDARPAAVRLHAIDWARGLAVLIMILAHVTDAWTRPDDRATSTYRYLTLLGGFAAPLFLWLSGASLVLAGEATLRHTGSLVAARQRVVRRGLELFILAFAFRAHAFVFNPGGSPLSIFRVDILNILGIAAAATGVLWGAIRSTAGRLVVFAAATTAVAMLTPMVRVGAWVDVLPIWLQWHIRPAGEHTVFTLFPWAGFVFAGAAAGVVLAKTRATWRVARIGSVLLISGAAVLLLGLYAGTLPTLYRQSSYWTNSPAFFTVRVGILLIALWVLWTIEHRFATSASAPAVLRLLRRLGQASLLVYWIHVHLVYGWASQPWHRSLSLVQVLVAYVFLCGMMYAAIPARDRIRAAWAGRQPQLERDVTPLASA